MVDLFNTAVISCMDYNFERNLVCDFLETLRGIADYNGKIIVMDYGMTNDVVDTVKYNYDVKVIKYVRDRHIFSIRFRDAAKVIADLSDEITHIMLIDSGDVWFQAPIQEVFNLCSTKLGCVEEHNSADPTCNGWNRNILAHLRREKACALAHNFRGTRNKNAGMICGPRQAVATMAEWIERYVKDCGVDLFGIDQIFFNFLINRMTAGEKIMLPERFNYVLLDHEAHLKIADNIVYDRDNSPVNVVHNAGGGYHRIINKECPATFNERQYHEVIGIVKGNS